MTLNEMIDEAKLLPVEERVQLVDSLLQSLNPAESDVTAAWLDVASRRMAEIRDGSVDAIPAEQVFQEIDTRLTKRTISFIPRLATS